MTLAILILALLAIAFIAFVWAVVHVGTRHDTPQPPERDQPSSDWERETWDPRKQDNAP